MRNREQRVHDSWAEIAGRIDGIACGSAEAEAQGQYEQGYRQGIECAEAGAGGGDKEDTEYEDKGANGFGDNVVPAVGQGRSGAEAGLYGAGVIGVVEMRFIG